MDREEDYQQLYKWNQDKNIYEWFEQRILSLEEIKEKYKKKQKEGKQELFFIQYNHQEIGFVQIYPFEEYELINIKDQLYEFDIFIEEAYTSQGIGTKIINEVSKKIFLEFQTNGIVLRPFKRNIRAIKCYQKCGYQIIKEYIGLDTLGNKEIILILLKEKR